jgi:two-component system response regulator MprA
MTRPILVVDDDPDIREAISDALRDTGYEVHTAVDGQHALEVLERLGQPTLILLDMMMPRMDGREFLRVLRTKEGADQHFVIVVSAGLDGFPDLPYIRKPFKFDKLLDQVRVYCG